MKLRLCLLVLMGCALAGAAQAAVERTIFPIELKQDARLPGGNSAFLQGKTNAYGHQFSVAGTQLQQPIAVGVYTAHPEQALKLRVTKGSFDDPLRELETDANGRIDLKFRTYDGFKLWVTSSQPSDYQLVVWVGNELKLTPPPAVVTEAEYEAGPATANGMEPTLGAAQPRSGLTSLQMGLIAGGVLVVLAGLFFFSRRKQARGTV